MNSVLLISMPSGMEWIIIIFAILLLFGGKKIPELMKGLGKGIREFNDAKNNINKELRDGMNEEPKKSEEK
ncbi:MAG: twin-arginine translocase TatA/TatE family subunit [Chitinophagales bacterium]|nr:twin-arginine translocase TatA/TatE family subunit [Chitinophagales bacterium]HAE12624.1 twin-arginine translocase TatA/TatE family subunit [Bacteroidota bacterium]MCB9022231.1 twin-arginine translocase TatA/TatE family subunit [Chitinophagales bacterium]HAE35774.1 twin-arginine translocase TatA/TatE family subunit [Bacteroidota bacterium]HPE98434.1 twin-arginine translocase TatA/TatE family subunit [Chitinophagales bacterium]